MKYLSRTTLTILTAVAVTMTAGLVKADSLTYSLNQFDVGGYTGPYGTVTVDWVNTTTANIIFTSGTVGGVTYLFMDGSSADLNVNASSFTASDVVGASPWSLKGINYGTQNVDGWGTFNLTIDGNAGFASAGDSVSFTLTDNSGTWANASAVLFYNSDGNYVAAHVAPSSAGGGNTGYVAGDEAGTPPPTPVPDGGSTVLLLGVTMSGFALIRRKLS